MATSTLNRKAYLAKKSEDKQVNRRIGGTRGMRVDERLRAIEDMRVLRELFSANLMMTDEEYTKIAEKYPRMKQVIDMARDQAFYPGEKQAPSWRPFMDLLDRCYGKVSDKLTITDNDTGETTLNSGQVIAIIRTDPFINAQTIDLPKESVITLKDPLE